MYIFGKLLNRQLAIFQPDNLEHLSLKAKLDSSQKSQTQNSNKIYLIFCVKKDVISIFFYVDLLYVTSYLTDILLYNDGCNIIL
jgi:hypothetical protein